MGAQYVVCTILQGFLLSARAWFTQVIREFHATFFLSTLQHISPVHDQPCSTTYLPCHSTNKMTTAFVTNHSVYHNLQHVE